MSTHRIKPFNPHPALVQHAEERAQNVENRIADHITAFSGSMRFVYLHIALFAVWSWRGMRYGVGQTHRKVPPYK